LLAPTYGCATKDEEVGGRVARSNLRDCATKDKDVGGCFARSDLRDCATKDEEVGGCVARSDLRMRGDNRANIPHIQYAVPTQTDKGVAVWCELNIRHHFQMTCEPMERFTCVDIE